MLQNARQMRDQLPVFEKLGSLKDSVCRALHKFQKRSYQQWKIIIFSNEFHKKINASHFVLFEVQCISETDNINEFILYDDMWKHDNM